MTITNAEQIAFMKTTDRKPTSRNDKETLAQIEPPKKVQTEKASFDGRLCWGNGCTTRQKDRMATVYPYALH